MIPLLETLFFVQIQLNGSFHEHTISQWTEKKRKLWKQIFQQGPHPSRYIAQKKEEKLTFLLLCSSLL